MQQNIQAKAGNSVAVRRCQMVVVALVVWAIPAMAAAHAGNNDSSMIHACIGNVSKVVRIVGVGGTCIASPPLVAETPAHWPLVQAAGTPGPKGDKGDPGIDGIDGTSVTFVGSFTGAANGCPNGGAIFAVGAVNAYVCNGQDAAAGGARADGPCFDTANRYVDCGNGTVTDTVTGLVWLKDANCFGYLDWVAAQATAATLANGACGLTDGSSAGDWRLPTRDEWAVTIAQAIALGCTGAAHPSLTDDAGTACYGDGAASSLVGVGRGSLELIFFWSGSTVAAAPTLAWGVNVGSGIITEYGVNTGGAHKGTSLNFHRTWPVRGGSR